MRWLCAVDGCRSGEYVGAGADLDATLLRSRAFWLGVVIIAVACLVRLPTLTWYSLSFDEGASLRFSNESYRSLFAHFSDLTIDRHPLLYYIVLKAWRQIAGDVDLMLRLPSAFAGILTVALIYGFGRRRLGEATAGLASLFIALSPLVVSQHQDARMYALALMFAVLAMGTFWELLDEPRAPVAGAFCISLALAGYTHVIAATLFPAFGLGLIVSYPRIRSDRRRAGLFGLGALGVSAALYAPYVLHILQKGSTGSGALSYPGVLRTSLGAVRTLLDYQTALHVPGHEWFLLALLGVIVVAAVYRSRRYGVTIALWFLSIFALSVVVTLRINLFQPKIFVFSAVPLALLTALAAWGESGTFRWYGSLPAFLLVGLALYGLSFQWRGSRQREDFRHAAQFLEARTTPADTVVVHVSWARFAFGHYYEDPFVHPFPNNVDENTPVGEMLQPYLDSNVLWLVQAGVDLSRPAGDPDHVVEGWLAERYPVVTAVFPKGVDVRGYATSYRLESLPDTATPMRIVYSNGLKLEGYDLPLRDLSSRDRWLHPPSTWVPVTLYWTVAEPLDADINVSISLEDEQGNVWGGELRRAMDLRAFHPPLAWEPGEVVRWDFDINANPQIPAGTYKVAVRVEPSEGEGALKHAGGEDWVILDRVHLSR